MKTIPAYLVEKPGSDNYYFIVRKGSPRFAKKSFLDSKEVSKNRVNIKSEVFTIGPKSGVDYVDDYVYPEKFYYSFYYRTGKNAWREIFSIVTDDFSSPSINRVNSVSSSGCYLYAVTLDAGASWHLWDTDLKIHDLKIDDVPKIDNVLIKENGQGAMKVSIISQSQTAHKEFTTQDYGQTWKVQ